MTNNRKKIDDICRKYGIFSGQKLFVRNTGHIRKFVIKEVCDCTIKGVIQIESTVSFDGVKSKSIIEEYAEFSIFDLGYKLYFSADDEQLEKSLLMKKKIYSDLEKDIDMLAEITHNKKGKLLLWSTIEAYAPDREVSTSDIKNILRGYKDLERQKLEENQFYKYNTNGEFFARIDLETIFGDTKGTISKNYYNKLYISKNPVGKTVKFPITKPFWKNLAGFTSPATMSKYKGNGQWFDMEYRFLDSGNVVDWRSPIAELYYNKSMKKMEFAYSNQLDLMHKKDPQYEYILENAFNEAPVKYVHKAILKRQFNELNDFVDIFYADSKTLKDADYDPFLISVLERNRNRKQLGNIIETIQSNQYSIIKTAPTENFIVQGCAGSGKTMVLLHRLSYIIYNFQLNVKDLFIVTPNESFNKHIEPLIKELGLDNVFCKTKNEYYRHLLSKYNVDTFNLSINDEIHEGVKKLYDNENLNNIQKQTKAIQKEINENACYNILCLLKEYGYEELISLDGIEFGCIADSFVNDYIQQLCVNIEKILSVFNGCSRHRREYEQNKEQFYYSLKVLETSIEKTLKEISAFQSTENQNVVEHTERKLSFWDRLFRSDKNSSNNIIKSNKEQEESELYYKKILKKIVGTDSDRQKNFETKMRNVLRENNIIVPQLNNIALLTQFYKCLLSGLNTLNNSDNPNSKLNFVRNKNYLDVLKYYEYDFDKPNNFENSYQYYLRDSILRKGIDDDLDFEEIVKKCKTILNDTKYDYYHYVFDLKEALGFRENDSMPTFFYYMLAYHFFGKLKTEKSYVFVDEAQEWSKFEYNLLRESFENVPILNLFGDVGQKTSLVGINNWRDVSNKFKIFELAENYRNTNEITEYSNKAFNKNMIAVGLSGKPVGSVDIENVLEEIVKLKKNCRVAIIVKDNEIRLDFKEKISSSSLASYDITISGVEDVKGVEFDIAYVLLDLMNENEKYIACTRALKELYIIEAQK